MTAVETVGDGTVAAVPLPTLAPAIAEPFLEYELASPDGAAARTNEASDLALLVQRQGGWPLHADTANKISGDPIGPISARRPGERGSGIVDPAPASWIGRRALMWCSPCGRGL